MSYIDKGGAIVYILIALNIIGFHYHFMQIFTSKKNAIISKIKSRVTINSCIFSN